jgi:hypothetical protein
MMVTTVAATHRRTTLSEGIMRGLKKGREAEFKLAAQLLDVVVLTLGAESEELYAEFSPVLSVFIKDPTASSVVRSVVRALTPPPGCVCVCVVSCVCVAHSVRCNVRRRPRRSRC